MADIDYPLEFDCADCDSTTTVRRSEVKRLHPEPDTRGAVRLLLQQRGWLKPPQESGFYCPDCIDS